MALDNFRRIDIRINKANYYIDTQMAKEGDYNGRELVVQITDDGEIKNQSGVSLNLGWRHDSVGNTGLDPFTVVDINKGIFKIAYPAEMLNAGLVTAVIQVVESGKITLTRNFKITVENNPIDEGAIVSENSFTALTEALVKVNEVTTQFEQMPTYSTIWSMANMGQDVKEAMTGGSVAVVGENAINNVNLNNNSVPVEKLSNNLQRTLGIQPLTLEWDIGNVNASGIYDPANNATISTLNFIVADRDIDIYLNNSNYQYTVSMYLMDGTFIGRHEGGWLSGNTIFNAIDNRKIKITIRKSDVAIVTKDDVNRYSNMIEIIKRDIALENMVDDIGELETDVATERERIDNIRVKTSLFVRQKGSGFLDIELGSIPNIYVKFDKLSMRGNNFQNGIVNIDLLWEDVVKDIDSSLFVVTPEGIENALVIGDGQMLSYNIELGKFEIILLHRQDILSNVPLLGNTVGELKDGLIVEMYNQYKIKEIGKTPIISGESDYPLFIKNEFYPMADKIQSVQTADTLTFGFITDTHYIEGVSSGAYSELGLNHMKYINAFSNYLDVDFLAHGGDIVNGYSLKDQTLREINTAVRNTRNNLNVPLAILRGNHDDNSYYTPKMDIVTLNDVMSPREWYVKAVKPIEDDFILDDNNSEGGYYYKDFEKQKVRTIFLNAEDLPFYAKTDGSPAYYPIWQYGFSGKQVEWLANKALNFNDKSSVGEWQTIILTHVSIKNSDFRVLIGSTGDANPTLSDVVDGLLTAFKTGSSFQSSQAGDFAHNINVDFSTQGPMEVPFMISGHVHYDLELEIEGTTYISTTCSAPQQREGGPDRTINTISEPSWDMFTLDKQNRKLYAHKFGAGEDRVFDY